MATARTGDVQLKRWARIDRRSNKRRERQPVSMAVLRIAELNRLFVHRYGRELPDDDAGRDDAQIVAHHIAALSIQPERRIVDWLGLRAPWMAPEIAGNLATAVLVKRIRWTADKLAVRLGLTSAERNRLKITTIGAIDQTKAERLVERRKRKRQADRERCRRARLAKGAKSRTDYETQSMTRQKPWENLGMSRASWYRAGKPSAGET